MIYDGGVPPATYFTTEETAAVSANVHLSHIFSCNTATTRIPSVSCMDEILKEKKHLSYAPLLVGWSVVTLSDFHSVCVSGPSVRTM